MSITIWNWLWEKAEAVLFSFHMYYFHWAKKWDKRTYPHLRAKRHKKHVGNKVWNTASGHITTMAKHFTIFFLFHCVRGGGDDGSFAVWRTGPGKRNCFAFILGLLEAERSRMLISSLTSSSSATRMHYVFLGWLYHIPEKFGCRKVLLLPQFTTDIKSFFVSLGQTRKSTLLSCASNIGNTAGESMRKGVVVIKADLVLDRVLFLKKSLFEILYMQTFEFL